MYNKSGSILRIETTINNTRDFRVYRRPNDDKGRSPSWQKMRKGVSDLHRRCQVSEQCNQRYADALASAQVREKLKEVAAGACNKIVRDGRMYRGLNPFGQDDYRLLMFLAKGENAINGFRNHDLREWLYPESQQSLADERKKYSSRTTRRIKLLRAHGLVRKVPRANRYVLTDKGQKFSVALMTASTLDIKELTDIAA
jgi:DNA-binding MarR family transcriptional regulator